MKTLISVIISFYFIIGCSEESNSLSSLDSFSFKRIAYQSLSKESKEIVSEHWLSADVKQGVYQQGEYGHLIVFNAEQKLSFSLTVSNYTFYENQKLIAVSFTTTNMIMIMGGPITIIIDYNSKEVIGYVPILG